jgi:hypothetical protein
MIKKDPVKIILLDATGEFEGLGKNLEIAENCHFHYKNLQEEDFFALFRPAGQVQLPKLQEAFKSLRVASVKGVDGPIAGVDSPEVKEGRLIKQGKQKFEFLKFVLANQSQIETSSILFDMQNLPRQIYFECVDEWTEGKWGSIAPRDRDNCASLIMRINSLIFNENCNAIFNFQNNLKDENHCVIEKINEFLLPSNKEKLLRINLRKIPKDSDISSVLVNAVGRFLLKKAESSLFKKSPLVVFLDEAHLFLNKRVKDEYSIETELNAFERIAKECRKYGLFLCLSTQRPRDIPPGVLSQVGTFIAHRLINQFDRDAVKNASPESSKYILSFLPSLKQGEAILMGVDFPMPINLRIKEVSEENKPNSGTPKLFKKYKK